MANNGTNLTVKEGAKSQGRNVIFGQPFDNIRRDFDRLFGELDRNLWLAPFSLFRGPVTGPGNGDADWFAVPAVDVVEKTDAYEITAEMPGMYGDDYDLVGVITGVIEKGRMITGADVAPGHVLIGLASNGLHTNGYSLARKVLFDTCRHTVETELPELDGSLGDGLLRPPLCDDTADRQGLDEGLVGRGRD